jgi:hypothetical protein
MHVRSLAALLFVRDVDCTETAQRVVGMLLERGAAPALDLAFGPPPPDRHVNSSPHVVRALMEAGWDAASKSALHWALNMLWAVTRREALPALEQPPPPPHLAEWARWGGHVTALAATALCAERRHALRNAQAALGPEGVEVLRQLAPIAAWARRAPLVLLRANLVRANDAGAEWGTL